MQLLPPGLTEAEVLGTVSGESGTCSRASVQTLVRRPCQVHIRVEEGSGGGAGCGRGEAGRRAAPSPPPPAAGRVWGLEGRGKEANQQVPASKLAPRLPVKQRQHSGKKGRKQPEQPEHKPPGREKKRGSTCSHNTCSPEVVRGPGPREARRPAERARHQRRRAASLSATLSLCCRLSEQPARSPPQLEFRSLDLKEADTEPVQRIPQYPSKTGDPVVYRIVVMYNAV